ncbi:hypothetical protein LZZ90_09765 [Flavobacterium sp. SM15]|uniref:hypothetical protein n=1 Tax=Flavobacterium sp. SM15 TaxID=2908005 RepID=UPI001EDB2345|nr:hypothetical protein [Flavobacterium sp. SM15]MCG2611789.1 hypothetical protein [Flavobacterium sp. SM15]
MEKQILIFVSKLFICLFFLISCNNFNYSKKNDGLVFFVTKGKDSIINGIVLRDTTSLLKNLGDVSDLISDDINMGECVTLVNESGNEFFKMRREYGGYKNQYDYFFVTKTNSSKKIKKIKDLNFKSNNGAYLGMSEIEFKEKYDLRKFIKEVKGNISTYIFKDVDDIYQSKFTFDQSKLIEFEFGYQD